MGKLYDQLDAPVRDFILAQHIFFVGSAPSGSTGHVNVSPKGVGGFRILGPTRVAYLDYAGSGVETIAHVRDNRRIVLMFCAFEGPPKIVRLHGLGTVIEPPEAAFAELLPQFAAQAQPRAIITVDLDRISDSCGFGVPLYEFRGERDALVAWADKKGPEGLDKYQREKNAASIDGLPGLRWVRPS